MSTAATWLPSRPCSAVMPTQRLSPAKPQGAPGETTMGAPAGRIAVEEPCADRALSLCVDLPEPAGQPRAGHRAAERGDHGADLRRFPADGGALVRAHPPGDHRPDRAQA